MGQTEGQGKKESFHIVCYMECQKPCKEQGLLGNGTKKMESGINGEEHLMSGRRQEKKKRKFIMGQIKVREAITITTSCTTLLSLTSLLLSGDICEDFW